MKLKDPGTWILIGFVIYLITALSNIGFIAVDDYHHGIVHFIPAQLRSAQQIIEVSGFRSPVPNLFLFGLAKTAYALGIESPANQLRFINCILVLLAQISVFSMIGIFKLSNKTDHKPLFAALLMALYFGNALFFTRPLIEALSAPFISASVYFLCAYLSRPRQLSLILSILFLSVAAVFRFQSGICFLAIPTIVFIKRRWSHFFTLSAFALVAFVGTGLIDYFLKGSFHSSLVQYVHFNLQHSSIFGTTPFYTFFLLFLALSIPPTFFSKFSDFKWREEYRALLPVVLYFLLFLLSHSAVPHKEERFMVPIFPLFLALLVPLLAYFYHRPAQHWRLKYFAAVNVLLLPFTSLSTVQQNTIGLARYIDTHAQIASVMGVDETLSVFPRALILRPDFEYGNIASEKLADYLPQNCSQLIAIRSAYVEKAEVALSSLKVVSEFSPGLPEQVVVKLNPGKNARRGPIVLYALKNCEF